MAVFDPKKTAEAIRRALASGWWSNDRYETERLTTEQRRAAEQTLAAIENV